MWQGGGRRRIPRASRLAVVMKKGAEAPWCGSGRGAGRSEAEVADQLVELTGEVLQVAA